jgi:hypothetical protein
MSTLENQPIPASTKKPWEKPELQTYGNLEEITNTVGSGHIRDMIGGAFNKSM